ncbi:hypothetical protein, partial [Pontimicrobium sp. MEBiC01747]
MNIELIPVIELNYYNEKVKTPNGSYLEFPKEWDNSHKENFLLASFNEEFKPYQSGMSFYKLNEIPNNNLIKIIADYFEEFESVKLITDNDIQPLDGGFILMVDGKNKIFPQCCGNLGDIESWEGIIDPENDYFWNGHPTPIIKQKSDNIIFDLSELNESEISINREKLKIALIKTKEELRCFVDRINRLEND